MENTKSWRDYPLVLVGGSHNTMSWKDLPADLEMDILLRLPVKSLLRSSSVNKSWYSLIKSPNFILAHINRSIAYANKNNEHFLLVTPKSMPHNQCSIISDKTFSVSHKIEIPFCTKTRTVQIVGSVHGLLCVTDGIPMDYCRNLYLWNPCIRKYRPLLSSCYKKLLSDWEKTYPVVGFGFHEPTNDYRIVRIFYCADCDYDYFGKLAPRVEVYSLRRNTWKKVGNTLVPRLASHDDCAFLNGAIYWLDAKRPGDCPQFRWILSFDFDNEIFLEIKCPGNLGVDEKAIVTLTEFKGSVSLCVFASNIEAVMRDKGMRCCIWVMRDEDGAVSWTKQFNVVIKEAMGWPLKFTRSGKLIMETIIPGTKDVAPLLSCNLENLQFRYLGNEEPCTLDAAYMESLVLL